MSLAKFYELFPRVRSRKQYVSKSKLQRFCMDLDFEEIAQEVLSASDRTFFLASARGLNRSAQADIFYSLYRKHRLPSQEHRGRPRKTTVTFTAEPGEWHWVKHPREVQNAGLYAGLPFKCQQDIVDMVIDAGPDGFTFNAVEGVIPNPHPDPYRYPATDAHGADDWHKYLIGAPAKPFADPEHPTLQEQVPWWWIGPTYAPGVSLEGNEVPPRPKDFQLTRKIWEYYMGRPIEPHARVFHVLVGRHIWFADLNPVHFKIKGCKE